MSALSIVLPVKLTPTEIEVKRVVDLTLGSTQAFLSPRSIAEVLIIANARDTDLLKAAISQSNLTLPIEYVNENQLCPSFKYMGGSGWFRQQVLKIAVASKCRSEHILVLDDDCIQTKKASFDDFLKDGKLLMSHIPMGAHKTFFESSCEILSYDIKHYDETEIVMNVTPEILSKSILLALQDEISQQWRETDFTVPLLYLSKHYEDRPRPFIQKLFPFMAKRKSLSPESLWSSKRPDCCNWTEYSLYWTYLKKHNRTNIYFDYKLDLCTAQIGDHGIWTNSQAEDFSLDTWLESTFSDLSSHWFAVVSSKITNIDWEILISKAKQAIWEKR